MLKFFIFFVLNVYSLETFAMCSGRSGEHLLVARFPNCEKLIEESRRIEDLEVAIRNICGDGCYNAFDDEVVSGCNKRFEMEYNKFLPNFLEIAKNYGCSDTGSYTQDSNSKGVSPNLSCKWLARSTVNLTCGGRRSSKNLCEGGGKNICVGEVICSSKFIYKGKTANPGAYAASCLTDQNCDEVEMATCLENNNTAVPEPSGYHPNLQPKINEVKGVN